jgi:predicted ATPase with chaperone activity
VLTIVFLKVRTIADLDAAPTVVSSHIAEAINTEA